MIPSTNTQNAGFAYDQREKYLNQMKVNETAGTIVPENPNKIYDDLSDLLTLATNSSQGVAVEHRTRYEQQQALNEKPKKPNAMPLILTAVAGFLLLSK